MARRLGVVNDWRLLVAWRRRGGDEIFQLFFLMSSLSTSKAFRGSVHRHGHQHEHARWKKREQEANEWVDGVEEGFPLVTFKLEWKFSAAD